MNIHIYIYIYLKSISHIDIESRGVWCDWDPQMIMKRDLEARNIVGCQDGQDLRVRMLSKTNPIVDIIVDIIILCRNWRVVIESENRVTINGPDHPAEHHRIRDLHSFCHDLQYLTCYFLHSLCVFFHCTPVMFTLSSSPYLQLLPSFFISMK